MIIGTSVVAVLKMGNVAHRAGIEPTSPAFLASVLTITLPRIPDTPPYPCLPPYAAPCLRDQCRLLHLNHQSFIQNDKCCTMSFSFQSIIVRNPIYWKVGYDFPL